MFERKLALTRRVEDDNKPMRNCVWRCYQAAAKSGMTLAQLILDRYFGLDDVGKLSWFLLLANDMDVSAETAISAIKDYHAEPNKAYETMIEAVEPARLQLIRRLNQTQDATAKLVKMREDLIRFLPNHHKLEN